MLRCGQENEKWRPRYLSSCQPQFLLVNILNKTDNYIFIIIIIICCLFWLFLCPFSVLRQRACSTSIPILRTIPPPNFGSRMRHSQPVSSPSCNPQKATNLTKGAMPITTHLTEKSGKFSFSADNLDSDKCCIPKIVPSSKSQTPKHDVSQSKDADLGLMGTPRNWRGLLSVSTGNMQTHV